MATTSKGRLAGKNAIITGGAGYDYDLLLTLHTRPRQMQF